jgi:uridine kinase
MRQIVEEDIPFVRRDILNKDAINIFKKNNYHEKARLFSQSTSLYTSVYTLGNLSDYFYGYLLPSTGYLKVFDLVKLYNGMLLRIPERKKPERLRPIILQEKMYDVIRDHKQWAHIMNAHDIGLVNEQVLAGHGGELIKIAEALHEKKIAQFAEQIKLRENVKLVLVSGPSSSGKTTFSKRLAIQLKVAGLSPIQISLDNYFVDRDKTPLDENGEYDFESIDALDLECFNQNIIDLNAGKTVEIPQFSFETGTRFYNGSKLTAHQGTIIIVEGIHALNPRLSEKIDDSVKFRIYVSALTQIGIDGHNRIPTTDNRLLRRIIRDFKYRGYSALDTLKRWSSVRRGEEKNIFPFQENADVMFNSALLYELGVIKKHAEPLLKEIWQTEPEYAEAARLLKFLSYFKDIPEKEIPPTSILREFLSDSSFHY